MHYIDLEIKMDNFIRYLDNYKKKKNVKYLDIINILNLSNLDYNNNNDNYYSDYSQSTWNSSQMPNYYQPEPNKRIIQNFTPLKISNRTAVETSTKLPVTDLKQAPHERLRRSIVGPPRTATPFYSWTPLWGGLTLCFA